MLFRKLLRDVGRNKTQFISIFLMAFLALFIYSGIGGEWRGLRKSANDFYANTNLADVFVYGSGFDDTALEAILSLDGVVSAHRRLEFRAVADFENKPEVTLFFMEANELSKPLMIDGEPFDIDDSDGIWICERFATARELQVGDTITLSALGQSITKEIRGIILSAEFVFLAQAEGLVPDFGSMGYAYLSHKAFPVPQMLQYSTLLIESDNTDGLENRISDALSGKYAVYLEQQNHPSVLMFNNEITQHKMMADVFPIVFLLIALLTMTRIVSAQRIQIATLKALGFKRRSIALHYVSYGFGLTLTGAVLGLVTGPLTLPPFFYPSMSGFYTLPEWKPAYDNTFILMAVIAVVLSTLVTYITVRTALRENAAAALRPKAPRNFKHSFIEKLAIWQKLGFNTQWNFRDSSRNKLRSLMAIIGVFGCTAMLVCAFGMNDSMNDLKSWQYEEIFRFDSKLTVNETATAEQIQSVLDTVYGEAILEEAIELRANDKKISANIRVTDGATLIVPTGLYLERVELPQDGVSITQKSASALGVSLGDEIEWHLYGSESWVTSTVAAIYREPTMQGLWLERAHFESYGYDFRPTSILTEQYVSEQHPGISAILSTSDILSGWDSLTEGMNTMIYLLILAASVLSIVVLYNLGLLAFTEMERDMATLKVMGLQTSKLRGLLLTQNIWFSLIGYALGIPGGLLLINAITASSGDSFDFPIRLHIPTVLISFAITFGLSVLVNLMFSRKIKRLNMVESLKAIE